MRIEEMRRGLVARLRERRGEIEQAALTRVSAISDPKETADPEYMQGLRLTVGAAIGYGIDALEGSEDRAPPIPTTLLSQARLAARNRVPLETVLRRYFAGYTMLGDFVIEEAERAGISRGSSLKRVLRVQAALFEQVVAAVSEEYGREVEWPDSAEERRARCVRRLLAGELLDAPELPYELNEYHLGAVATGRGGAEALKDIAKALDRRLLTVNQENDTLWAWFGARRPFDPEQLAELSRWGLPAGMRLAIGEPGEGLTGWRLSHRQALAALPVAQRTGCKFARYGDEALLAATLQDDLLIASLCRLYLDPLEDERDGGATLRATLCAYFASGRNSSSAASRLGVSDRTVANRLRTVEARLGRQPGIDMEIALRLHELGVSGPRPFLAAP
ncbi:MAG TPA: helix-turn-helix domain-containing protein [Solirubrobacterales bacterium]|nr:helix-turn-helix domain-containing protein [Solirubrobacterales bacterium]